MATAKIQVELDEKELRDAAIEVAKRAIGGKAVGGCHCTFLFDGAADSLAGAVVEFTWAKEAGR